MENKKKPMTLTPVSKTLVSKTPETPEEVPIIKKSQKDINKEKVAKYIAHNGRPITGQFFIYGMRGKREMSLQWKLDAGDWRVLPVVHGQTITIPFGYAKYLNEHGRIKRTTSTGLHLTDRDGNKMPIKAEDDERRYEFRPTQVLSAEDMQELDSSGIVRAIT
jgi:hypothetical protein